MKTHARSTGLILAGMVLAVLTLTLPAQAQPPAVAGPPSGHNIQPEFLNGTPSCQDRGFRYGFLLYETPPNSGTFRLIHDDGTLTGDDQPQDPSNAVSVQINDSGTEFDWTATLGIDAVIVAAANDADIFTYPEESTGDTQLHGPLLTQPNSLRKILHIEFCFDYELSISKSAETEYTRTYPWGINKTADLETLTLDAGGQGESQYRVAVFQASPPVDSDWQVSGRIQIVNKTPFEATITGVIDTISPGIPAPTSCDASLPINLPAGKILYCPYMATLPDGTPRTNTATIETEGVVDGGTATAPVTFGDPTHLVNQTIHVTDTNGESWQCNGAVVQSCSWGYTETFSCPEDQNDHHNVATIQETGQSASATVTVVCNDPPPASQLFCLWSPNKKYLVLSHSDFQQYVDETCPDVGTGWSFESCTADPSSGGCTITSGTSGTSGGELCVQADRDGTDEDGRRYTVKIRSTPACAGTGTVGYILVPHDQSTTTGCLSASAKSCP